MSKPETWKSWEGRVVDGKFRLRQYLGCSDHSAVFLTETPAPRPVEAAIPLPLDLPPADPVYVEKRLDKAGQQLLEGVSQYLSRQAQELMQTPPQPSGQELRGRHNHATVAVEMVKQRKLVVRHDHVVLDVAAQMLVDAVALQLAKVDIAPGRRRHQAERAHGGASVSSGRIAIACGVIPMHPSTTIMASTTTHACSVNGLRPGHRASSGAGVSKPMSVYAIHRQNKIGVMY